MDLGIPGPRLAAPKPRYRGVSHQFGFMVAMGAGVVLVAMAPAGRATWTTAVFAAALTWQLGISALYHRPTWSHPARQRLRRLDHASIFVLIGGTYTPVCVFALPAADARALLAIVWGGVVVGTLVAMFWNRRPRGITAVLYLGLGWLAVVYAEPLRRALAGPALALILLGGVLYSSGALIYALRRPNPLPAVFGYHEVFHALVLLAGASHFAAIVWLVHGGR